MADALIGSIAETDSALLLTDSDGAKVRLTASGGALVVSVEGTDVFTTGGTSGAALVVDTPSYKFLSNYFDNGATSGTSVGDYTKLTVTGAGGSGVAARPYAVVDGVTGATVHGTQSSVSFANSGKVTGLADGLYANILLPATAVTGTLCAITAEVYSEDAASDPAGASLSVIRVSNAGNATGMADVDDDCVLFDFTGWTVGDGNMIAVKSAGAAPNVVNSIRIRLPDGSLGYIMVSASPLTA